MPIKFLSLLGIEYAKTLHIISDAYPLNLVRYRFQKVTNVINMPENRTWYYILWIVGKSGIIISRNSRILYLLSIAWWSNPCLKINVSCWCIALHNHTSHFFKFIYKILTTIMTLKLMGQKWNGLNFRDRKIDCTKFWDFSTGKSVSDMTEKYEIWFQSEYY